MHWICEATRKVDLCIVLIFPTGFYTYTKNAINEWIVTAIRHGKPMATEKYDIDVPITEKRIDIRYSSIYYFHYSICMLQCKYKCIFCILISAFF